MRDTHKATVSSATDDSFFVYRVSGVNRQGENYERFFTSHVDAVDCARIDSEIGYTNVEVHARIVWEK